MIEIGCGHTFFLASEDEDLLATGNDFELRRPCPVCGGTMILLPTP